MIAAQAVLAHAGNKRQLELLVHEAAEKPRTEWGCHLVLAIMSSMLTPDCRLSIWITDPVCFARPLLAAWLARGCLASFAAQSCGCRLALAGHARRSLRGSVFFSVIDTKGEKAAIGDEQAERTVILVSTPFRRAICPSLLD